MRNISHTSAVLTFNGSTPLQCSQVDITNDEIVENNETFFIQLGSTGDPVNISLDSATVAITDDDCEYWIVLTLKMIYLAIKMMELRFLVFYSSLQW